MKKYTEMTRKEIRSIVERGGSDLVKLNDMVARHIDGLKLSEDARDMIDSTECGMMAECFGGLFTEAEVEGYVNEVRGNV